MLSVSLRHEAAASFGYTHAMPLMPTLLQALSYVSRVCGFDTIDSFPPGHQHARTRWNRAYFDIASDVKPEQIERSLCESISNTPLIFSHIIHPTPAMQRTLLAVIETRMRRSCGNPVDLAALLVNAYRSAHTQEAMPGLRTAIEQSGYDVRAVMAFLEATPAAFGVIEAAP
jgi:uncharacterized membrane protein